MEPRKLSIKVALGKDFATTTEDGEVILAAVLEECVLYPEQDVLVLFDGCDCALPALHVFVGCMYRPQNVQYKHRVRFVGENEMGYDMLEKVMLNAKDYFDKDEADRRGG